MTKQAPQVWWVRLLAYCAFAAGVAGVATVAHFKLEIGAQLSTTILYLEGQALRCGAAGIIAGIGCTAERRIRVRPLRGLLVAFVLKLLGGLIQGLDGWVLMLVAALLPHTSRQPVPAHWTTDIVVEHLVPLALGLPLAFAAAFAVAALRSLGYPSLFGVLLETRWRASFAAALVAQTLSGRWGIDSYGFGFPIPFYDSSIRGGGLQGPQAFWPFFVLEDVLITAALFVGLAMAAGRIGRRGK